MAAVKRQVGVANEESRAGHYNNNDNTPATHSASANTSSYQRYPPIDIGSRSIIAEPRIDYAHPHQAVHPTHNPSSAHQDPLHDMAGLPLPLFGFRQWMAGGSAVSPSQSAPDPNMSSTSLSAARPRQAGIRENTEESCDLPKSNDILQHIAEFHHSRAHQIPKPQEHHVPADHTTSAIDRSLIERVNPHQAYDNIEAEIDSLKEDVLRLRQGADKSRQTPKTDDDVAMDKFLSTRSRQRQIHDAQSSQESAAARLQSLHEMQNGSVLQHATHMTTTALPSQTDFPALSQPSTTPSTPSNGRRPSYAHAASTGMMDAIKQTFSTVSKITSNGQTLDSASDGPMSAHSMIDSPDMCTTLTSSTEVTSCAEDSKDDEETVIMLHRPNIPASSPADSASPKATLDHSPSGKAKSVPHFAQPTKSFARRAGETLRNDSAASLSPKSPRDSSPTKNAKDNGSISTAKRTNHQPPKRKSLPGEWTQTSNQTAEQKDRQASTLLPIAKKQVKGKLAQAQAISPRRHKNSYMAPTAAATQRNMVTMDSYKPQFEQVRRINELALGIDIPPAETTGAQRPNTSGSETSSVCFITDSSNGLTATLDHLTTYHPTPMIQMGAKNGQDFTSCSSATITAPPSISETSLVTLQSPSNVPSFRSQERLRCHSIASDGLGVVSGVHNTTTKRRTSHGDLLKPIVARLESQGLLKEHTGRDLVGDASMAGALVPSYGTGYSPLQASPARRSLDRSDRSSVESGGTYWKAMPPHLRRLLGASSVASLSATMGEQLVSESGFNPQGTTQQKCSANKGRRDSVLSGMTVSSTQGVTARPNTPTMPTLRATAEVFEPRRAHSDAVPVYEGQLPTNYVPDHIWSQLSPDLRDRIMNLRAARTGRPWCTLPNGRMQHHGPSPMHEHFFNSHQMISSSADQQRALQVGQASMPFSVQSGQMLTPTLSPGKKSVHWTLQDIDGEETPVKFGRAPPPGLTGSLGPSTPSMSSISSNSSPPKTPSTCQGWRIGSTFAPRPYGWKGGDGKEISFVGYGPHAERDPNSVVGFEFGGKRASYSAGISNGFAEEGENNVPGSFIAPRSQRQWAEKLGYTKLPCGSIEVTHAVEQMPFASQLAGYCYDCAGR